MARPIKYTVDELKESIDMYFAKCDMNEKPYTVTGLALFLGINKSTLNTWEDRTIKFCGMTEDEIEEFSNSIKIAKLRIENYAEETLFTARNPAGVIFNLKNNWNWVDRQEINSNVTQNGPQLPPMSTEEIRKLLSETE